MIVAKYREMISKRKKTGQKRLNFFQVLRPALPVREAQPHASPKKIEQICAKQGQREHCLKFLELKLKNFNRTANARAVFKVHVHRAHRILCCVTKIRF